MQKTSACVVRLLAKQLLQLDYVTQCTQNKMTQYGSILTLLTVTNAIAADEVLYYNLQTNRGKLSSNSSSVMTSVRVRSRLEEL